jgi:cobalt-zinc-cadmium efflux system membrane fusion protein
VEAGAPLVSIASPSIASVRGELARAQILVRAAEAEVARQREMSESNVGIASERLRAEAELAEARAMLSAIRASSGSIGQGSAASVIVRAPIAGTVLERRASVGATVDSGGEPLIVIGEPNAVWVVSEVFERELPLVQQGARAQLSIASVPRPLAATVAAIGGAVDAITRRAHVYLTLDDSADLAGVRAGMYARASIEASEGGLGIPTSAVLVKEGGRTVVYVAADERTFFPRDVHIGAPSDGRAPVLSGLAPNDRIVVRGALLLDGTSDLLR